MPYLPLSQEHENLRQLILLKALDTFDPVAANAAALLGLASILDSWENIYPVLRDISQKLEELRIEIHQARTMPVVNNTQVTIDWELQNALKAIANNLQMGMKFS